jgi:hypothetical protein
MSKTSPNPNKQDPLLQGLLKSGLPLEAQVATILDRQGFEVMGEYGYMRPDPAGVLKKHSVDIRARKFIVNTNNEHWADFELLVECKYNHPSCHWVFAPGKFTGHGYGGTATLHDDLCPSRTRNHDLAEASLWDIDGKTERCIKGAVLFSKGNGNGRGGSVEAAVEHGASQLRHAVPQLLARALQYQAHMESDDRVTAIVLCPLLVTNAPLHVLKKGATVRRVQDARSLSEVTKEYQFVRLAQALGPDLEDYADALTETALKSSRVDARLTEVAAILGTSKPTLAPSGWKIRFAVRKATEVVMVVRLEYLSRLIRWYLTRLDAIGGDIVHYATLEPGPQGSASRLRGLDASLLDDSLDALASRRRDP